MYTAQVYAVYDNLNEVLFSLSETHPPSISSSSYSRTVNRVTETMFDGGGLGRRNATREAAVLTQFGSGLLHTRQAFFLKPLHIYAV